MIDLEGRVAIVTGSSSGIGEATARQLALAGANVVVNSSTSVEAGQAVSESLPVDSIYVSADISDEGQRKVLVDRTIGRFGRLDILVNNAGWTTPVTHSDLEALTDEIFDKTFRVNVFGTWGLTKEAMPFLKESNDGCVVNVTSVAGIRPVGSSVAYAMSKAALNHMTLLLAKACAPVRVNAVAPGLIDTPWTAKFDSVRRQVEAEAPLGRSGRPDEIAEAVLSLIGNTYVTGVIMVVDGGVNLVR